MKALRVLTSDAGSGALLALAALAAVLLANSPLAGPYHAAFGATLALPGLGAHSLADWIKEGPMAVFFLAVGLELKHEFRHGELADMRRAMLPVAAAVGGMIAPAGLYLVLNAGAHGHPAGWPVPVATDIAFALAALAVAAPKASPQLRLFLLTLAVVDDLGAVALIAALYSHGAHAGPLILAGLALAATALLGRWRRAPHALYAIAFLVVLALVLKGGLSTSLAGVATAVMIPDERLVPYQKRLAPWMALLVLPLFALSSAGVSLADLGGGQILAPVSLGVAAGLLLGKPLGVLAGAVAACSLGVARRPPGLAWRDLAAAASLCGVGFTMSLYLAALAFPLNGSHAAQAKAGVLAGSLASAAAGALVLRRRRVTT
jgi:NhaA family Na+:H+ antiporter